MRRGKRLGHKDCVDIVCGHRAEHPIAQHTRRVEHAHERRVGHQGVHVRRVDRPSLAHLLAQEERLAPTARAGVEHHLAVSRTHHQRERLRAKPGITGLWQISYHRQEAIHENLDYDVYYVENQSLLLDVVIIALTMIAVVKGTGAH